MTYLKTLVLAGMLAMGVSVNGEAKETTQTDNVAVAAIAQVNINTATAEELAEMLTGVGIKRAEAIVAFRDKLGGFKRAEQLMDVKGIGEATFEKNRSIIQL